MSKFTQDCLILIFKEIKKDVKALHSCLLVNRLWCESVVSILWKNPLEFCQSNSLYNTIISLLPPESKEILINNGIDIFSKTFQRPSFNYVGFIKSLNTYEIHYMIQRLIESNHFQQNDYKFFFEQEIWKMIMSQTRRFKHLLLNGSGRINQFYDFFGAKDCLANLVTLTCNVEVDPSVFYGLAQICHNIKKLYLDDCLRDNDGLTYLIESQRNLQYFICNFDYYDYFDYQNGRSVCQRTGVALTKNAHSLISFESCKKLTFQPSIFTHFINLRILKLGLGSLSFIGGFDFTEFYAEEFHLQQVQLPKLQHLALSWHSLHTAAKIIESTKGDLIEVRIDYGIASTKENTSSFLKAIIKHCPYLKLAALFFYDDDDLRELENLFLACPHLEKLVLVHDVLIEKRVSGDDILNVLAKYAPLSLRSIKVDGFMFSTINLKSFFDEWKGRRQPLSFYNIECDEQVYRFNDEVFNMINTYIEEGVIKKFEEVKSDDRFIDWDQEFRK